MMRAHATADFLVEAKKKGRASFYSEYEIQICAVQRENEFRR